MIPNAPPVPTGSQDEVWPVATLLKSLRPHLPGCLPRPPLSERELEVLQAVARGETNKGVAVQPGITERTVKAHLARVYNKLGVDSRAAAIAIAVQKGWVVA